LTSRRVLPAGSWQNSCLIFDGAARRTFRDVMEIFWLISQKNV